MIKIKKKYDDALKRKYAMGAFNFSTSDIAKAISQTARKLKAPVICETSSGEMSHLNPDVARGIINGLNKTQDFLILHLDHGKKFEYVKSAIKAGYDSVHFDGSALSYEKNIRLTKKSADYAAKKGIWIEGEIGHVSGISTLHKDITYESIKKEIVMTEPSEAKEFVEKTGVNSLAVNIGNVHGVWKGLPNIDFKRLEKIYKLVKMPLVLHGGSGISASQIKKALKLGITKVNENTDLRVAYSNSLRNDLKDKKMFIPTKYLPNAVYAVSKVVEQKIRLFGSVNKL